MIRIEISTRKFAAFLIGLMLIIGVVVHMAGTYGLPS